VFSVFQVFLPFLTTFDFYTGPARTGKSTLLTYLLRYLTGNPEGEFECSNQAISCTVGIWMWPELINWVDPKTKKTRKILLLDVEGLGALDAQANERRAENKDYFLQLFAFSCMISSVMVFNSCAVPVAFVETAWTEIAALAGALKSFSSKNSANWMHNRYAQTTTKPREAWKK
jgi:hypothetical protein